MVTCALEIEYCVRGYNGLDSTGTEDADCGVTIPTGGPPDTLLVPKLEPTPTGVAVATAV